MIRPQVLVHRSDPDLDTELKQALASINGIYPVLHIHDEIRNTIEAASAYQPSILMVEMSTDLESIRAVVDECIAVSPDITIVGICGLSGSATESDGNLMMSGLRIGVEDFIRRPISSTDLSSLFTRRLVSRREKKATPGTLLSFISNKGGVGKSTCAVNVAVELATRHPDSVLLIDCSLQMGVCAAHLNVEPVATITDAMNQRERLDAQLFQQLTTRHPSGLHLLAAPANAIEAAEIDDAFISRVLLLARRTYDYVIVDTFPLFDRTVMAVLDLSDQAYIVAENVVPTLKTIRGFFQLLTEVGFSEDRWRVLVNRFTTQSGAPNLERVEHFLGRPVDHVVPYDKKIVLSANLGQPLVLSKFRWNKSQVAFRKLVDSIEQEIQHSVEIPESNDRETAQQSARSFTDSQPAIPSKHSPTISDMEGA